MSRVSLATLVLCGALAVAAPSAVADGLPVVGLDGSAGVASGDGASRFLTLAVGARHTVIERLKLPSGEVARYRTLPGQWSIPLVAYDGTGSGLSADGRTLVVIRNRTRFPQSRTHLAVIDPIRLRVERRLTLQGDFSFDAISPDGSSVYLINYLSRDPTDYAVRVFDLRSGHLVPGAIVDPHEPGEQMRGFPITRSTSPDGRWAYTLYGGGDHPFVHALDTAGRTARCIDIDALAGRQDLFSLRLKTAPGGGRLTIASKQGRPLALVDTRTFRVSAPARAHAPVTRQAAPADNGRPWLVPAAIAVLLLVVTGAGYAGRNRMLARAARAR